MAHSVTKLSAGQVMNCHVALQNLHKCSSFFFFFLSCQCDVEHFLWSGKDPLTWVICSEHAHTITYRQYASSKLMFHANIWKWLTFIESYFTSIKGDSADLLRQQAQVWHLLIQALYQNAVGTRRTTISNTCAKCKGCPDWVNKVTKCCHLNGERL